MVIEMVLYGLKSSNAAFRSKLAGALYDELNNMPSLSDPDVWMRPSIKVSGERYYEHVLCYNGNGTKCWTLSSEKYSRPQ